MKIYNISLFLENIDKKNNMKYTSYEANFVLIFGGHILMKNHVKELRIALGLTQEQLAEKVGVSSRTIISLEKGKYKPSIILAYKLSLIFNESIEYIFELAENLKKEEETK